MTKSLLAVLTALFFCTATFAKTAPASEPPHPLSSHDRYIAGGIVGTIFGLGIGHAIQGRFADKGWIFTTTELGSIALIVVGAVVPMPRAASIPIIVVGALGLSAFKIWEIVDVWTGPMPYSYGLQKIGDTDHLALRSLGDAPLTNPTMAGLTFRF